MNLVYSYTLSTNKWIMLPECTQSCFAMAIVQEKLVAVGGYVGKKKTDATTTNTLVGLTPVKVWDDILPPMPTKRASPAVAVTSKQLIVIGGKISPPFVLDGGLNTVEVLDLTFLQWTTACPLPNMIDYPQMVLCEKSFYVSNINDRTVCMCSEADLIRSSKQNRPNNPTTPKPVPVLPPKPSSSNKGPPSVPSKPPASTTETIWKRIADFHLSGGVTMIAMGGKLLAMGGHDREHHPNGVISHYDRHSNSWKVVSQLFTPRWGALAAILPGKRLLIIGGHTSTSESCDTTDIGKLNL